MGTTVAMPVQFEGGTAPRTPRGSVLPRARLLALQFVTAALAVVLGVSVAHAQPPPAQFELIGASEEWLAFRENIQEAHEPLADCRYPGLSAATRAMRVHFVRLSEPDKRGELVQIDRFDQSFTIYEPTSDATGCTSQELSEQRRKQADAFALKHGFAISNPIHPLVAFGSVVQAEACEAAKKVVGHTGCDERYEAKIDGQPIRLARILTAVPRAPDYVTCQFVGHRFVLGLQVSWLDLGTAESLYAPGGFAEHYDCRAQSFMPIRLYALPEIIIVLASFRGDNIADFNEHLSVIVMPRKP